jgi:hypothetical protein
MKNKILFILPLVALVVAFFVMLTTSFNVKPDVYLWSWFGYDFGLDFSSRMPFLRIAFVVVGGVSWFFISKRLSKAQKSDKTTSEEMAEMSEAA